MVEIFLRRKNVFSVDECERLFTESDMTYFPLEGF